MSAILETLKGVVKGSEEEDVFTSAIEGQTARVPSSLFLGFALASMGISLGLTASGRKQLGNFVGQWVPTFLLLGIYNKMVKQHGH